MNHTLWLEQCCPAGASHGHFMVLRETVYWIRMAILWFSLFMEPMPNKGQILEYHLKTESLTRNFWFKLKSFSFMSNLPNFPEDPWLQVWDLQGHATTDLLYCFAAVGMMSPTNWRSLYTSFGYLVVNCYFHITSSPPVQYEFDVMIGKEGVWWYHHHHKQPAVALLSHVVSRK